MDACCVEKQTNVLLAYQSVRTTCSTDEARTRRHTVIDRPTYFHLYLWHRAIVNAQVPQMNGSIEVTARVILSIG